jgi:DNA-binding response OmpR family regulator
MKRVLVVDDELTLSKNVTRSLERAGYSVEPALTGGDARFALDHGSFNAMCLDIDLPDCNGLDLLEEIRADHPAMKVVMISCDISTEYRRRAKRLGASEYLTKPFRLTALQEALAGDVD